MSPEFQGSTQRVTGEFKCDICGQQLLTKKMLMQHLRIHSDNHHMYWWDELYLFHLWVCCNPEFKMENHRKMHFNEFKAKCHICDMGSYANSDLQEHKNIHTRACHFKCDKCGKSFPYQNNLTTHKKTQTRLETRGETMPMWNVQQDVCSSIFLISAQQVPYWREPLGDMCGKAVASKDTGWFTQERNTWPVWSVEKDSTRAVICVSISAHIQVRNTTPLTTVGVFHSKLHTCYS
jgi:KRAB domain-containing zinc finger protein